MSTNQVDTTLKGFRRDRFQSQKRLLNRVVFCCALSDVSIRMSPFGSVMSLLLAPPIGVLSDKFSKDRVLSGCLSTLAICRAGSFLVTKGGVKSHPFDALAIAMYSCLAVISKAAFAEMADIPSELTDSSIDISLHGIAGACLSPAFCRLFNYLWGSETGSALASIIAAAGAACAILVESDLGQTTEGNSDDSLVAYTPFNLTRLASTSKDATRALAASFLSHVAGPGVMIGLLEEQVVASSPLASSRLRFLVISTAAQVAGTAVFQKLHKTLSLDESATIAAYASMCTAVALCLRKPYLSLIFLALSARQSDETDVFMMMSRKGTHDLGEASAALSNLNSTGQFCGAIFLRYICAQGGYGALLASVVSSSLLAEHLRRDLRQKRLLI